MYQATYHCTTIVVTDCSAVHSTVLHLTALHWTTLDCTILHFTALDCTILHFTSLDCTILHFTSLDCTILHFTSLDFTILHFTSLHFPVRLWQQNVSAILGPVETCVHEVQTNEIKGEKKLTIKWDKKTQKKVF